MSEKKGKKETIEITQKVSTAKNVTKVIEKREVLDSEGNVLMVKSRIKKIIK